MIATTQELMRELHARGMVTDSPASDSPAHPASDRPWYIGMLLGASGWVAGVFVLGFVYTLFKPDSPGAELAIGLVLLAAAWVLFAVDRKAAFTSQLALALSVAGQIAVLFGAYGLLFKVPDGIAGLAFIALLLQLAMLGAMPNRLHRTMSTLFACIAWALFVRYGLWDEPGWRGTGGDTHAHTSLGLALAGWAIVWFPVGGGLYALIRREPAWMVAGWQAIIRPVSIGLIAGLAVATLLSYPLELYFFWIADAQHQENALALWPLLSALAALGAMAAAFALGSRGLVAVCIVAALLHMSYFYYVMGTSLLVKSATMLLLGALLMGAARHMKRPASP